MFQHFRGYSGPFDYSPVRSEVPVEYGNAAFFVIRVLNRTNHRTIGYRGPLYVFTHCRTGYRHNIFVDQPQLIEFFHNSLDAAGQVQVLKAVRSGRDHVAEMRGLFADFIEDSQRQIQLGLVGNSKYMEHRVC